MFLLEIIAFTILIVFGISSTFIESGVMFSITTFLSFSLVAFIFKNDLPSFIIQNYIIILICTIGYFILGSLWSIYKWYILNIKVRNFYNENKWLYDSKSPSGFVSSMRSKLGYENITFPPKASKMKSSIILWISGWPYSIISYILGDLVLDIVNYIYAKLSSIYSMITKNIFKDIDISE